MIDSSQLPSLSLVLLVFGVAFLYSSVGFGGASGYLAAMSLFGLSTQLMAGTALVLNVLVASIAFVAYRRAGHFTASLLWPFLLTSIPASFLGGIVRVQDDVYLILLYVALTYVGLRLLLMSDVAEVGQTGRAGMPWPAVLTGGAAIGLVSGILGLGGGIFLSPLIVLTGWGTSKQAASVSAGFIVVNSASALLGRAAAGTLVVGVLGAALLPVGVVGALLGSHLGARHLSGRTLRRLLGLILLVAVIRFWLGS